MSQPSNPSRDRQGASGPSVATGRLENPPLAYMLTFTAYGTWLHGDERGSVDRWNNTLGNEALAPDPRRNEYVSQFRLKAPPFRLDAVARLIVTEAIRYVCERRDWALHAVNVRTNHVHAVVSGSERLEAILTAPKAWSTRRLAEAGVVQRSRPVWTRHGSTRYAWTDEDLQDMCWYVVEGQGPPLAEPPSQPGAGRSLPVAARLPTGLDIQATP